MQRALGKMEEDMNVSILEAGSLFFICGSYLKKKIEA